MIIKKALFLLLICMVSLLMWTCEDDEVISREYPRLRTLNVTDISASGASFKADILNPGPTGVTEYGFVWSDNPFVSVESSERLIIKEGVTGNSFSARIENLLVENVEYYVRAYARDEDDLVYGNVVTFVSLGSNAPTVFSAEPSNGILGDTIRLKGKGFSYLTSKNKIRFNSFSTRAILEATDTTLVTIVPDSLNTTESMITVGFAGNRGPGTAFSLLPPQIDSLSTNQGDVGDTVAIYGKRFGTAPQHVKVFIGEADAQVISYNTSKILVKIPEVPENTETLRLHVGHQQTEAPFAFFYPKIIDFSPEIATWGDTITLNLKDFLTDDYQFFVNNQPYDVISKTSEVIKWVIPNDLISSSEFRLSIRAGSEVLHFPDFISLRPPVMKPVKDTVALGSEVFLNVEYLHPDNNNNRLEIQYYQGSQIVNYIRHSKTLISFELPLNPPGMRDVSPQSNDLLIELTIGYLFSEYVKVQFDGPVIESITPIRTTSLDQQVIIRGRNFGSSPTVRMGNTFLNIIYGGNEEVAVTVPMSVLRHPDVSQTLRSELRVTNNDIQRSGWSTNQLEVNHIRAMGWANESGILWQENGFYPRRRLYYTGWNHDDMAYIIGGQIRTWQAVSDNSFYQFNPSNNSWRQLASVPVGQDRFYEDYLNYNGYLYLLLNVNQRMTLFRYTFASNTWTSLATLGSTIPNGYKTLFEANGRIFATAAGLVYEYLPAESRWTETGATVPARIHWAYTKDGQRVVRMDSGDYIFDVNTLSWNVVDNQEQVFTSVFEYDGKLYTMIDNQHVYEYDPITKSSTFVFTLPAKGNKVFGVNGKLYFFMKDYPQDMLSFDLIF
jgi:hypothetical protein